MSISGNDQNLINASSIGNIKLVKELLEKGTNIEVQNRDGWTPLLCASWNGHDQIVAELLAKGANLNVIDENLGWTPNKSYNYGHIDVTKHLLQKGENIQAIKRGGRYTALILASLRGHIKVVKELIRKGANIEAQTFGEDNALIHASEYGHLAVVRELIAQGANIEAKNYYSFTPLIQASRYGQIEVVKELIAHGANINAKNYFEYTALVEASEYGHTEVVKELILYGANIEARNYYDYTALTYACEYGHIDVVKELTTKGAFSEVRNWYGRSALIYACDNGHTEVVKHLLEKGVNPEMKSKDSRIPLIYAVQTQRKDIIDLLTKFRVFLSFDKFKEETINEFVKDVFEGNKIFKCDTLELSNVVIYFLTKQFIQSDKFKEDWSKRKDKVFLIILLENIQSLMDFDLNQFCVSHFYDSVLTEKKKAMSRNKVFLSQLIKLKNFASVNMDNEESNPNKFALQIGKISSKFFVKTIELISDKIVIVKSFDEKILVIDWNIGSILGRIECQAVILGSQFCEEEQEFCWISHLNQIFCSRKLSYERNVEVELKCSLFSIKGDQIRTVYSIFKSNHRVNSIVYNKTNFEVYLNIYDATSTKRSIFILNKEFNLINLIDNNLSNPILSLYLDYTSEIILFNVPYNIFHYNSKIAFLQKFGEWDDNHQNVYIFDKSSFSIIDTIKVNQKLICVHHDKMFFMSKTSYIIEKVPLLKSNLLEYDVFCVFCRLNSFKKSHLITNPYLLPCGNSACLDCIHQHYNIFKRTLQCGICNQEHKLPQKLEPQKNSIECNFLPEMVLIMMINDNEKILSKSDDKWLSFDNKFHTIDHLIDVEIESLKMQIEMHGDDLIKKINKFIKINGLKQEKAAETGKVTFKICNDNIKLDSSKIGSFYPPLNTNEWIPGSIEKFIKRVCKCLQ